MYDVVKSQSGRKSLFEQRLTTQLGLNTESSGKWIGREGISSLASAACSTVARKISRYSPYPSLPARGSGRGRRALSDRCNGAIEVLRTLPRPTRCQGKTVGGNGPGLIQDLTEKSVGSRAKNDLCSAGTSPHVLETNANLAVQPASNRRNPVVLEVDAPKLSS